MISRKNFPILGYSLRGKISSSAIDYAFLDFWANSFARFFDSSTIDSYGLRVPSSSLSTIESSESELDTFEGLMNSAILS